MVYQFGINQHYVVLPLVFLWRNIEFAKVNKVNEAEKYILSLDISNVRVRYHHNIARVEVNDIDIQP